MSSHFSQRPRTQPMPPQCKKGWAKPTPGLWPQRLQVLIVVTPGPTHANPKQQVWTIQLRRDPLLPTFNFLGFQQYGNATFHVSYQWFPDLQHYVFAAELYTEGEEPERWSFSHQAKTILDAPLETGDIDSELSTLTTARFSILL